MVEHLGSELAVMRASLWALQMAVGKVRAKVEPKGEMTVLRLVGCSELDLAARSAGKSGVKKAAMTAVKTVAMKAGTTDG